MPNPNPPSLEDSLKFLQRTDHFAVVVTELVTMRENAIRDAGEADTEFKERKAVSKITVYTEILDMFDVPTGTAAPTPPAEEPVS